jgi:hypothetical protein
MARVALRWSSFYLPFLLTTLVGVPVVGFVQSFEGLLGLWLFLASLPSRPANGKIAYWWLILS